MACSEAFSKKKSFLVVPKAAKKNLNQFFNDTSMANCIDPYIPQQTSLCNVFLLEQYIEKFVRLEASFKPSTR